MIYFRIPTLYSGVYSMESILDLAQRYYGEFRRWSLVEEEIEGIRVLEDKQSGERFEIPPFHFALFPAGNPVLVSADIVMALARPYPSYVINYGDSAEAKANLIKLVNDSGRKSGGATLREIDGSLVFRHARVYEGYPRWNSRSNTISFSEADKVDHVLRDGDVLFFYSYPREHTDAYDKNIIGELDYIPASRLQDLTRVPLVDSIDLTQPIDRADWTKIWPKSSLPTT